MNRPTLVFDDDCGFCTYWARYIANHSTVELVGFSDLDDELEAKLPEDWQSSAHLITEDTIYSGGASMEEAALYTPLGKVLRPPIKFLRQFNAYTRFREAVYRWIADHRGLLGRYMSSPPPARE